MSEDGPIARAAPPHAEEVRLRTSPNSWRFARLVSGVHILRALQYVAALGVLWIHLTDPGVTGFFAARFNWMISGTAFKPYVYRALIGWVKGYDRQGVEIAEFPNVKKWVDRMLARPAVAKAIEIRRDPPTDLSKDKEAQKILFGQRAR